MSAHGLCECASGIVSRYGCCGGKGPAAFEVIRDGKPVRLCTRCDLARDRSTRKLLVTESDSIDEYAEHDFLGAVVLRGLLAEPAP